MGIDPRDVLEMLAYYESYGNEAPKEVKVVDLINLSNECLRLRESLQNIYDTDITLPDSNETMKTLAKEGIGKVNWIKI